MSMKKRVFLLVSVSFLVIGFTIWNVWDFCRSRERGTAAYLAVMLNLAALAELARLIVKEVKSRHGR